MNSSLVDGCSQSIAFLEAFTFSALAAAVRVRKNHLCRILRLRQLISFSGSRTWKIFFCMLVGRILHRSRHLLNYYKLVADQINMTAEIKGEFKRVESSFRNWVTGE